MAANDPQRGDVWLVNLDPTKGREQAGTRPALIVSADLLNASRAELVILVPITSRNRAIATHVGIDPPEGGLTMASYAKTEDVRSVSIDRLKKKLGRVTTTTMATVSDRLRIVMDL